MLAMTSGAGHDHSGRFKIANVGTKKANVPPWTIGNLNTLLKDLIQDENDRIAYLIPIVH